MTKYNVIMITLDGLRGDRVSLCPFLYSLAKRSIFFPYMVTAAPYTFSAVHALFSGIYPSRNGVNSYFNMYRFRKEVCKTVTGYLHDNGYYTSGDICNTSILPPGDFDKLNVYDENKDDLKENAIKFIKGASSHERFFLYLHPEHIHTNTIRDIGKKYDDFSQEFFDNVEGNIKRYNSYLKEADDYVQFVFDYLETSGLLNDTIVVILSDHGVSNGEKIGERMYGSFVYNYTINTFCVIVHPEIKNKEIPYRIRNVDLLPTMLEFLDIPVDDSYEILDGKTLLPFIEGNENEDRIAFSETGGLNGPWPSRKEHNVFCLIEDNWKIIFNKIPNTYELYNLAEDKDEKNNLLRDESEVFERLKYKLHDQLKINKIII